MKKIFFVFVLLFSANAASALEFQWKFVMPAIDNRETAVNVYEILDEIQGVYDIELNMERNSVMFFFDDEKTTEEVAEKKLKDAGYEIEKMMLLEEPKGGVMN